MRKYVFEYLLNKNICITFIVFLSGFSFTVIYLDSPFKIVWVLLGMALYTITEYFVHRFIFHMTPPKNKYLLKLIKRLHYDHHINSTEVKLIFLPIWYSLPIIASVVISFYLIINNVVSTIALLTGITGFLLYYEWVHFIAHRPIKPKTRWGRRMKKLHLLHHYKNENYWFGVTTPAYDILLKTYKEKENVIGKSNFKEKKSVNQ